MHTITRLVLTILLFSMVFCEGAVAQSKYPDKPIAAIVMYAPGSAVDLAGRVLSESLAKYLKQTVVIVNKTGGAGSIAGNALAKAKPDGYTIGVFNSAQPNPECMENPERFTYKTGDLLAVAQFTIKANGLFVRYDAPWNTAKEFVEYAKKNPSKLKWGHSGRGGLFWINGSMFERKAGIKMLDVPFEGDAQNLAALLGGHVNASILTVGGTAADQVTAKKIKPLFIAAPERSEVIPSLPTAAEVGYPVGRAVYNGVFVPKGTPLEVIAKLDDAIKKACADPEYIDKMRKLDFPIVYRGPRDFQKIVNDFGEFKCGALKTLGVL